MQAWAREHWPDAVQTHAWSAQDWSPASRLPYAGPIAPGANHILFAGAYSKWGMTNAPAAALRLTEAVIEGRSRPGIYDPWHPRRLAGAAHAAGLNAAVGGTFLSGWLRLHNPSRTDVAPAPDVTTDGAVVRCPLSRVCTHLGGALNWNKAEGSWDCPLHGSRFDRDGDVLDGPATRALPRGTP